MFTEKDISQFDSKNINIKTIDKQIKNFKEGFKFINLHAAATKNNGVIAFNDKEIERLIDLYSEESKKRNVLKFVPASGAASRMFKHLFEFIENYKGTDENYNQLISDKSFNSVYYFLENIRDIAFFDDLKQIMSKNGYDIKKCLANKDYVTIVKYLLNETGLNYAQKPKGLLKFHNYPEGSRMSIEEHLVEGAKYCKDKNNKAFIHFTVSPEHKESFIEQINIVKKKFEKKFNVEYIISYSEQKPSTDTIAVDLDNKPFRETDSSILFRPGGHGALIENLNDIKGDIIFIKNIDNIVPDKLREQTYIYKKVIAGYLIELQTKIFEYLHLLENKNIDQAKLKEVITFAKEELNIDIKENFNILPKKEKTEYLFTKLNRPIRVCGMVKNEGEPGGGPFKVVNSDGDISLQIVESSQINFDINSQKEIVGNATHFNPVDLVCGVRNYKGEQFDLRKFVDPATGFISIKSKNGNKLKAQELPGLWNGAMANWITIFVETPIITFNPVKTVNDLLREQHQ
ncbi:MAG: DUF4301 family protein [Bacteroidales bacterium]|nr:DUF4301 family protein [Bacteroidales bacterium]